MLPIMKYSIDDWQFLYFSDEGINSQQDIWVIIPAIRPNIIPSTMFDGFKNNNASNAPNGSLIDDISVQKNAFFFLFVP